MSLSTRLAGMFAGAAVVTLTFLPAVTVTVLPWTRRRERAPQAMAAESSPI